MSRPFYSDAKKAKNVSFFFFFFFFVTLFLFPRDLSGTITDRDIINKPLEPLRPQTRIQTDTQTRERETSAATGGVCATRCMRCGLKCGAEVAGATSSERFLVYSHASKQQLADEIFSRVSGDFRRLTSTAAGAAV